MANLETIDPRLSEADKTCRVVVETPKGKRSKYRYDAETQAFELGGLLPEGMTFPLDFGFIPSTKAEDGDALDIAVLADEPQVAGTLVTVRLIGVIEAEQTEDGETVRNDRLLGVSHVSKLYERVTTAEDLGDEYLKNLEAFWVQYNQLKGKGFRVLATRGPEAALAAIKASLA